MSHELADVDPDETAKWLDPFAGERLSHLSAPPAQLVTTGVTDGRRDRDREIGQVRHQLVQLAQRARVHRRVEPLGKLFLAQPAVREMALQNGTEHVALGVRSPWARAGHFVACPFARSVSPVLHDASIPQPRPGAAHAP